MPRVVDLHRSGKPEGGSEEEILLMERVVAPPDDPVVAGLEHRAGAVEIGIVAATREPPAGREEGERAAPRAPRPRHAPGPERSHPGAQADWGLESHRGREADRPGRVAGLRAANDL